MKLVLLAVGIPIFLFICYLLYRSRVGHVIAIHMYRFENSYKEILEETKSKELALRKSLVTFKDCPVFNRLTDIEYEQIISILKESPFPEKIVGKIVIGMDSKTGLKAFQSTEFLTKMASVRNEA